MVPLSIPACNCARNIFQRDHGHHTGQARPCLVERQVYQAFPIPVHFGLCNNRLQMPRTNFRMGYCRFEKAHNWILHCLLPLCSVIQSKSTQSTIDYATFRCRWTMDTAVCCFTRGTTMGRGNGGHHAKSLWLTKFQIISKTEHHRRCLNPLTSPYHLRNH